jgi:NADP-dependent 3-hydroxy acid dehydrogenase YdfG
MLVGITGTTRGLGQALKNLFLLHGHEVKEFNRSNGYDIMQPGAIVRDSQDCDVFVNNAYSGFGQVDLLYALCESWEHREDRYIVNIGSERTRRWMTTGVDWKSCPRGSVYRTHKIALAESVEYLYQQFAWPKLCLVDPGALSTPPAEYWNTYRSQLATVSCEQVANMIYNIVEQCNQYWVSELVVRPATFFKDV